MFLHFSSNYLVSSPVRQEDLRGFFKAFKAAQGATQPRTNRSQELVLHILWCSAGDTQPEFYQEDTTATQYHVAYGAVASSLHLLGKQYPSCSLSELVLCGTTSPYRLQRDVTAIPRLPLIDHASHGRIVRAHTCM